MKNINKLFLSALLFMAVSCSSNDDNPAAQGNITSTATEFNVDYVGATETVEVEASGEWGAYSNNDWITCSSAGSIDKAGTVKITVKNNTRFYEREGSVLLKSGAGRQIVKIKQAGKPKPADLVEPEGYEVVWLDEFDMGTEPSSEWNYETGGGGWGNNELQNYVAGYKDSEQLAVVKDGILSITAKKIEGTVYSIRMNTNESWTYGYFEARLKLPGKKGTWPAFWMMPKNFKTWPDDGEIDIMEYVGYEKDVTHSAIHTKSYNHSIGTQKEASKIIPNMESEYHLYALEWTADKITTYVDGQVVFTFNNDKEGKKETWPFDAPFYIKLNLAWGGNWGGAQGIDESALPAVYEIDYVRVFQKK